MVRLTRAQQQERTRAAVLVAAAAEFAAHGFAAAKVDQIAERAELTRGAVYSNFPSKRALYLALLVETVEREAVADLPAASPGPRPMRWVRSPVSGSNDCPWWATQKPRCTRARSPPWSMMLRAAWHWRGSPVWRCCCWLSRWSRARPRMRNRCGRCGGPISSCGC